MKKTYLVTLTRDGKNPNGTSIKTTIQAESEYEAIKQAEKTHSNLKVAAIKEK